MIAQLLSEYGEIYDAQVASAREHAELERKLFLVSVSYGLEKALTTLTREERGFLFGDLDQLETVAWSRAYPPTSASLAVRIECRFLPTLVIFADRGSSIVNLVDLSRETQNTATLIDPQGRRKVVTLIGQALVRAGLLDPVTRQLTIPGEAHAAPTARPADVTVSVEAV